MKCINRYFYKKSTDIMNVHKGHFYFLDVFIKTKMNVFVGKHFYFFHFGLLNNVITALYCIFLEYTNKVIGTKFKRNIFFSLRERENPI